MTWLFPIGLLALLALPLIVLLHLVRQRRPRLRVPTLMIWQALITPPPEQRKRRIPLTLLLLLHMLAAFVLALALGNPTLAVLTGPTIPTHTVLLLDTSTSMGANDQRPSRWAAAQEAARDLIEALDRGDSLTLVELSATPRLLAVGGPEDRAQLLNLVQRLAPAGNGVDLPAALTLANSTMTTDQQQRVVVLTDTALAASSRPLTIAATLDWRTFGGAAPNTAIVAFAARQLRDGDNALYARVVNWDTAPAGRTLRLLVDEQLFNQQAIQVPAAGATEYSWRIPAGASQVRLTLEGDDALPADDQAALLLNTAETIRVRLISADDTALEQVLAALPGLSVTVAAAVDPAATPVDLTVLHRQLPAQLPAGPLLIINPPDDPRLPGALSSANLRAESAALDPAFSGIDLSSVQWRGIRRFSRIPESLVPVIQTTSDEPLVLRGTFADQQVVIWAFDVDASNLPAKLAFPLLAAASVQHLTAAPLPPTLPPGNQLPPISLIGPDGKRAPANGRFDQPGIYSLAEDQLRGGVAINFGDQAESNLAAQPRPAITVAALTSIPQPPDQGWSLWPLLVALGLVFVAVEWYYLHRQGV